jgi:hypothetical protein
MHNGYLVEKPEGRWSLGRLRRRWEDIIKKNLRENAWRAMDWIHLAQDRDCGWPLVKAVMNLCVPHNDENFLNS